MTSSSINSTNYNNFHGYSGYGLNYFNDSASEYSDEYQNSLSPISLPEHQSQYTAAATHYNGFYNQTLSKNYQNDHTFYQQPYTPSKNLPVNIEKFSSCREEQRTEMKFPKVQEKLINRCENFDKKGIEQKSLPASPEILKRRRVAANARERRRMNNLNFAFDR